MNLIWAPLAIDRVAEITAYIAEDNPVAAKKWIRDVFARTGQLALFPQSGRHLPETARKDLRELIWGNYRIIYRIRQEVVEILTLYHGARLFDPRQLK